VSFKPGDVVQLKSGGPTMTVTGVVGQDPLLNVLKAAQGLSDGDIAVEYFDSANKLVKHTFKASSVVLFEI
jgi:uncharacterized protein YodC (DUF2158 family)